MDAWKCFPVGEFAKYIFELGISSPVPLQVASKNGCHDLWMGRTKKLMADFSKGHCGEVIECVVLSDLVLE